MPRSITNLPHIPDDDRSSIPGYAAAMELNWTPAFQRKFNKVAARYWRYMDWFEKKNWNNIERFAKYLSIQHNISADTAWELSAEYWKGRSS